MSKTRRKNHRTTNERTPSVTLEEGLPTSRRVILAATCAIIALFVFLPTLNYQFVDWDDTGVLTENPDWRGLGPAELKWMFTTNHFGHYQPVTWLTYGVDYVIWGMNPRGYHLTNVLFHAANTALVWFVASFLLRAALPGLTRERPWLIALAATFVALAFAVHPLRVESVAWATERRDLVSAFFILMTILVYLRSTSLVGVRRFRWFTAALAIYLISMLSKVGGAPLPLVLVVLDWYPLRRIDLYPSRWHYFGSFGALMEKIPFLLVSFIFSFATIQQQQTGRWLIPLEQHGLFARTAQAFYGLVFYGWKTLLPVGLSPLYELRFPLDPFQTRFIASAVIVFVAAAIILWQWRRWPALLAAAAVYTLMIGPLLGFFQNGPQIVADRYSYLSTLSWVMLLAGGAAVLIHRYGTSAMRNAMVAAAAIAVGALAWLTVQQAAVWENTETLWKSVLDADAESSFANNSYGFVLLERGEVESAEALFRRALEINPWNREALYNLANARRQRGDSDIDAYRAALAYNPDNVEMSFNLGTSLLKARRNDEAVQTLQHVVNLNPTHARARTNLGVALLRLNRLDESLQHLDIASQLDPTLWNARDNLALVLLRQGREDDARRVLELLLQHNPGYTPARQRLESLNNG